ncbi:VOC family protein [Chryseolinea sp. H1M3-3]|uniref:VOC family protein n=1 Tax=Chryseolinea sp. H1M3-3 TaxID=3034144 RepID=UPI0023EBCDC7|nr:VOC family protein [Chryseolinea sp. H1M3-3]
MKEQVETKAINLKGLAPLLQVFDMPTSLHFYRDVLGFKVVQSSGEGDDVDWVLLELNGIDLMLNTAYEKPNRPSHPDLKRNESHRDTVLYFGCPDTDAAYWFLTEKGLKLQKPAITGYGWKALNITDPDGYGLCFHWPANAGKGDVIE